MEAPIFPLSLRLEPTSNQSAVSFDLLLFAFNCLGQVFLFFYYLILLFPFSFSVWLGVLLAISRTATLKTDCLLSLRIVFARHSPPLQELKKTPGSDAQLPSPKAPSQPLPPSPRHFPRPSPCPSPFNSTPPSFPPPQLPCFRHPGTVLLFISFSFGRGRTEQGPFLAWLELLFLLASPLANFGEAASMAVCW